MDGDILKDIGIKISFVANDDDFIDPSNFTKYYRTINETLSRIGIANKREKILFPSCYLVSNEYGFKIAHFKELFPLIRDGASNEMTNVDYDRRDTIVKLLSNWGLVNILDDTFEECNTFVFVLPFKEKREWNIKHKIKIRNLKI